MEFDEEVPRWHLVRPARACFENVVMPMLQVIAHTTGGDDQVAALQAHLCFAKGAVVGEGPGVLLEPT